MCCHVLSCGGVAFKSPNTNSNKMSCEFDPAASPTYSTLQWFGPISAVLLMVVNVIVPTVRFKRQNPGVEPIVLSLQDTAYDFIGRWTPFGTLGSVLYMCLWSFAPSYYQYVSPVRYLAGSYWLMVGGIVIWTAGLVLVAIAQYQMGISWRIGIDKKVSTPLVMNGLYARSRNPIYVGTYVAAD